MQGRLQVSIKTPARVSRSVICSHRRLLLWSPTIVAIPSLCQHFLVLSQRVHLQQWVGMSELLFDCRSRPQSSFQVEFSLLSWMFGKILGRRLWDLHCMLHFETSSLSKDFWQNNLTQHLTKHEPFICKSHIQMKNKESFWDKFSVTLWSRWNLSSMRWAPLAFMSNPSFRAIWRMRSVGSISQGRMLSRTIATLTTIRRLQLKLSATSAWASASVLWRLVVFEKAEVVAVEAGKELTNHAHTYPVESTIYTCSKESRFTVLPSLPGRTSKLLPRPLNKCREVYSVAQWFSKPLAYNP